MEFVKGLSLADAIANTQAKPCKEEQEFVMGLLLDVLRGLKTLHDKGIVHRDLQPRNVLVRDGRAVLVDFGVSKYLHSGTETSVWEEIGTRRYKQSTTCRSPHNAHDTL